MKKILKYGLVIFGAIILLALVFPTSNKKEPVTTQEKSVGEVKKEIEERIGKVVKPTVLEKKETRWAILSGTETDTASDAYGELVVPIINIWQKAGGGGVDNVAIGNTPHGTKVEVLENKEVDGVVFYHIRSSVGKVSVLPTDWEARGKAMEERPESEWFVDADVSFPVEGWVTDSFINEE